MSTSELAFLWLEITGQYQLASTHCYANSSPSGTHGVMTTADWTAVLDEAADLGTKTVQFIGGEPTLNQGLSHLVGHALAVGIRVEVFSNLTHVSQRLGEVFSQPGVSLATSYYSDTPDQHEAITRRQGSYRRTKVNIIEALRRSIPLRVGLIDVSDEQRVAQARAELAALGYRVRQRSRPPGRARRCEFPSRRITAMWSLCPRQDRYLTRW